MENTENITLKISSEKKAAFLDMLKLFDFVEVLEEPKPTNSEESLPYYDPNKVSYSVEDIQAIADRFPSDHPWTYQDISKYFPSDLLISVQIIQNQLFIMASPSLKHQEISNELTVQFSVFVKKNKLGKVLSAPMDTRFDDNNILQPDILYVAVSRYHILEENIVNGAPDLVVEIWSPGNTSDEKAMKQEQYRKNAVTEYWQIEPKAQKVKIEVLNAEQQYEIFSEATKTGKVKSKVLEGFELEIETLFEEN